MQVSAPPEQAADSPARNRPIVSVCPVCHGRAFAPRFTVKDIPVAHCETCGLVVQNPQPSDDTLAAIYGSDYFIGSSANDRFASQFDLVKRATAALQLDEIGAWLRARGKAAQGLRLLEVGCGHGNMLIEARARGYDVTGLDYSADAAQTANRKLGAEIVRVGEIGRTPLPERSFDICILIDVIEHVRDPENFMTEVLRLLEDGGAVFIATPSVDSWSARALGRHWMEFKREHLFFFGRETITRLLRNTGFADIAVSTGKKVLTPDYIIGHFEKFPIPVISPSLRALRAITPQALLSRPVKLTASGINVFAVKSQRA